MELRLKSDFDNFHRRDDKNGFGDTSGQASYRSKGRVLVMLIALLGKASPKTC